MTAWTALAALVAALDVVFLVLVALRLRARRVVVAERERDADQATLASRIIAEPTAAGRQAIAGGAL